MNWFDAMDGYCERLAPGIGGEPFNMLTGLTFVVAGVLAWRLGGSGDDRRAAAALACVGLASFLHHTMALSVTLWADSAANFLYLVALGTLMLRRLGGVGLAAAGVAALAIVTLAYGLAMSPVVRGWLGPGADLFLWLAILLVALGGVLQTRAPQTARGVLAAGAVLTLGLPFRFGDATACAHWPLGTHGVWHVLNAISCVLLLSALARHLALPPATLAKAGEGR